MGAQTQLNEPITYYEWDATLGRHGTFRGIVRVVLDEHRNGIQHLRIDDENVPAGFRNINNVSSEEEWDDKADMDGSDGWERYDEGWTP